MAGTLTVDTIQSDSSYASTLNVASKMNFTSGMQIGGQDTTFGGMRNRIINGAMMIDQRNSGASVTGIYGGVYAVDRFPVYGSIANKCTIQQTPSTTETGYATRLNAGFANYLQVTSSGVTTFGSTDEYEIFHKIEANNVSDLQWGTSNAKPVTLSFWVRSSLTGTFGGQFSNASYNRSYVFSYTINSTNTWEQKTITVPGDTSGSWTTTGTGLGIYLSFDLGSGTSLRTTAGSWVAGYYTSVTGAVSVLGTSGATYAITGVQLEKGSTATAFEQLHYGHILALCQRYYYFSNPSNQAKTGGAWGSMYSGSTAHLNGPLPVTMRASPTFTFGGSSNTYYISNINGASSGTPQNSASSPTIIDFEVTSLSGGAVGYPCMYNGQLSITAEL